jgi:hypothetical protein
MKRKESYEAFLATHKDQIEAELLQPLGQLTTDYKRNNPQADPYKDKTLVEIDNLKRLTFNMLQI